MEKIIREVNDGIIQVTVADERWYMKPLAKTLAAGERIRYHAVPSVTWITSYYPKGTAFYKWLASKGWDEAEAIKQAAGDKGSKVHYAIGDIIKGQKVKMEAKYMNHTSKKEEELTLEEYECLMSFAEWWDTCNPRTIAAEITVYKIDGYVNIVGGFRITPEEWEQLPVEQQLEYYVDGYAGTIDWVGYIKNEKTGLDEVWILDWKTSQSVWPEFYGQVTAYKYAISKEFYEKFKIEKIDRLGVLQVGYRANKFKKYKLTEIQDKWAKFLAAKEFWAEENEGVIPAKKDYPEFIQVEIKTN